MPHAFFFQDVSPLKCFLLCLSAGLIIAGRSFAAEPAVLWPLPPAPPGIPKACYPAPRVEWFINFQQNLDKLKGGPYDLILDGDSITDIWQIRGMEVWNHHFAGIKMANFAIAGDQVQNVIWRLQHGELEGQDPKLIELLIGTNNLSQDPKDVVAGIKLLIHEYETRCPHADILLLALFPRAADPKNASRTRIAMLNQSLSQLVADKRIIYLDFGAKFLQPDGILTADIMPDFLHPSVKGYEIWADAITPIIDRYFPPASRKTSASP